VEVLELLGILVSARDMLADESRWSPVHIATDEDGRWLPVGSHQASRFNLQGAVIRAAGHRARDAMKTTESALRACSSAKFATTLTVPRPMTQVESLDWLDTAISSLAAQIRRDELASSKSQSAISGLRRRVTDIDATPRKTTGTGDDED
jgi:hypothetical protein